MSSLTQARGTVDALKEEIMNECSKFSQDIKFWAEFQTGIKVKTNHIITEVGFNNRQHFKSIVQEFEPWLATSEERKDSGLAKPETLAEACSILGESKVRSESNFKSFFLSIGNIL